MYATRNQTSKENDCENVKSKVVNRPPVNPPANRRALADVGNLVGDLSSRCNVSKAEKANGAIGTKHSKGNLEAPKVSAPISIPEKWGTKGMRSNQLRVKQDSSSHVVSSETSSMATGDGSTASNVIAPGRVKQVYTRNARSNAAKIAKEQSMTATLTARSEDAAGSCDSEMTVVKELPLPDIDYLDRNNPLAVADYVEDIYCWYRKAESQSMVSADYMLSQQDINDKMRAILIDWLVEVHLKFKLMPETLYLTTNLIDRFLELQQVSRKNLQLVGVTAMLLASKYEEIWAPEVKDFVYISDNAYTKDQILAMEKLMLNSLKFNLTIPTPYVFASRFLKAAQSDKQGQTLAWFFVELSLPEYSMLQFSPSHLAAAAVYLSQRMLGKFPVWTIALERHSGFTEVQLRLCVSLMIGLHEKSGTGNLTAVHKKYSHPKLLEVAKLPPATLPAEDDSSRC